MKKQIGQEHWVLDDRGDLKGLYSISGDKAKAVYGAKDYWGAVDAIVREYAMIHPQEIKEQRAENQLTKDNNFNEFGKSQTGSFRQALELPVGLYNILWEYDDKIFTNKKTLHSFMKRYPVFTTAKTI